MSSTLYIVIPCYHEEKALPETTKALTAKMDSLIKRRLVSEESKIVYVDDGSKDATWTVIEQLAASNAYILGVRLSKNRGHQNALLAGLLYAKDHADFVVSMDADLQDDINAVDAFIKKHEAGADIVYGVRSKRDKDTFFKRATAEGFYVIMEKFGVDIVFNHADYRLMSKRALDALSQYKEANLFLRGIIPTIGFPAETVMYERNERVAGETKYTLAKMLNFAADGITSFSVKPIRIITTVGFLMFVISICVMLYSLFVKFFGYTVSGWTTLSCSIWMLGGIQLLSLGIIGEYVGKMYMESKKRPRFFIDKVLDKNAK